MYPTSVFWGSWWASQCHGHRKKDISSALLCSLKILYWVVVPAQGCAQATWMGRWYQMSLSCLIQEGMNRKKKCFPGSSSGTSSAREFAVASELLQPLTGVLISCWLPARATSEMVIWVRLRWVQGTQGECWPLCHPFGRGAASLTTVGGVQLLCCPQKAHAVGSVQWVMFLQGKSPVRPILSLPWARRGMCCWGRSQ